MNAKQINGYPKMAHYIWSIHLRSTCINMVLTRTLDLYGFVEHLSPSASGRTKENVNAQDRLLVDSSDGRGEICTWWHLSFLMLNLNKQGFIDI